MKTFQSGIFTRVLSIWGSNGKPVLNEDNTIPEPIGYDKNKENVFFVIKENGEPILHINYKNNVFKL